MIRLKPLHSYLREAERVFTPVRSHGLLLRRGRMYYARTPTTTRRRNDRNTTSVRGRVAHCMSSPLPHVSTP